jgi:hypothetical protein
MNYAIVDTLLGLLLAGAAIGIPRVIALRKNHPEDETDARAYMKETGRSAQDIAQGNAALESQQQGDATTQDVPTQKASGSESQIRRDIERQSGSAH